MCKTNDVTEQTTRYRNAETNSGAPYTKVKLRPSKSGKGMVAVNSIFTAGSTLAMAIFKRHARFLLLSVQRGIYASASDALS